jgi:hypothetical protein
MVAGVGRPAVWLALLHLVLLRWQQQRKCLLLLLLPPQ